MDTLNRWHAAKFEATGQPCEVVATYHNGEDGPLLLYILLADGRRLLPISKGRYETIWAEVVVSADPDAP